MSATHCKKSGLFTAQSIYGRGDNVRGRRDLKLTGLKQDVKNSLKRNYSILRDWLHMGPWVLLGSLEVRIEYSYSQLFSGLGGDERREQDDTVHGRLWLLFSCQTKPAAPTASDCSVFPP